MHMAEEPSLLPATDLLDLIDNSYLLAVNHGNRQQDSTLKPLPPVPHARTNPSLESQSLRWSGTNQSQERLSDRIFLPITEMASSIPIVKKRTKVFKRHQSDRYHGVKEAWRKPKGAFGSTTRLASPRHRGLTVYSLPPQVLITEFDEGSRVKPPCPRSDTDRTRRPST